MSAVRALLFTRLHIDHVGRLGLWRAPTKRFLKSSSRTCDSAQPNYRRNDLLKIAIACIDYNAKTAYAVADKHKSVICEFPTFNQNAVLILTKSVPTSFAVAAQCEDLNYNINFSPTYSPEGNARSKNLHSSPNLAANNLERKRKRTAGETKAPPPSNRTFPRSSVAEKKPNRFLISNVPQPRP